MMFTASKCPALLTLTALLGAVVFECVLRAAPTPTPSPTARALEDLASKDEKAKRLARECLLRPGPGQISKLKAVRDQLNEMLAMAEDLKSPKRDKAVAAVEYFTNNGAAEYVVLALANPNREAWPAAIEGLSKLNQKSVLPKVLDALEKNNFVQEGSEVATVHRRINTSLIQLVGKLTGKAYKADPLDTEAVDDIIKDARKKK
jgi:hypothetical protein